jgi:hypothetical protein
MQVQHPDISVLWFADAFDAFNCSRLTGPVRTYDAENLAPSHLKRHIVHRYNRTIRFAQVFHLDNHNIAHESPFLRLASVFASVSSVI